MEDEKIVALYLERDENAITQTQSKYGRILEGLSKGIVGDVETAKECVNDTYMKTWNSIPPNEPVGYFFPFIARIARNLSLNEYKKQHTQKREAHMVSLSGELDECIVGTDTTQEGVNSILIRESLNRFLEKLPEEKRKIFIRRYWYMDEINVIADAYGYSTSKVKSMLFQIRKKLRVHFEEDGVMEREVDL